MKWLILIGAVFSAGCSLIGIRTEEVPQYEVIHAERVYEIREYPSYLIAETKVEGDYDEAVNKGFRRLAAYIFGNNLGYVIDNCSSRMLNFSGTTEKHPEV